LKIECTPQELKELTENKTSVAGTTDELLTEKQLKQIGNYFSRQC